MSELFLSLLNRAIAAGWLVLAVVVLRLALRRAPRRIHCALWGLVGLRLVWPFSLKSALSLLPSAETVPPEILYDPSPTIHTGVESFNAAINPILSQTMAPNLGDSVNPLQVYTAVAANLWLLVLLALLVHTAVSYLRIRRRVATAVMTEDGVYECEFIAFPFLLGLIRPHIYLPFAMEPEQREFVLAHERAHLLRRDHWWKPVSWLLACVFWFHPLLWLAYVLLGRDMELACDEAVIGAMDLDEKKAYSHALLSCSAPHRVLSACPLAFGEVGVKERIRAVLHYKKPTFWLVAAAVAAVAVAAVCFLTDPLPQAEEESDLPSVSWRYSLPSPAPWQRAFLFDFGGLNYTYVKATCDAGILYGYSDDTGFDDASTSVILSDGLALYWSPFADISSLVPTGTPPDTGKIDVTVYKGIRKLYTGTIHLTCTDRVERLACAYEARMDGDLRLLLWESPIGGSGAQVIPKTQYEAATSPLFPSGQLDPTLPAVSWTYSPAGSATWFHQFSFDFGELEYTHIEATCDTGELMRFEGASGSPRSVNLPKGLSLAWSPFTGAFTHTPDRATIDFTVYNGLLPLHTGTIHLTCTFRKDLTSIYEARMDGDLRILRDAIGTGARVITRAHYEAAISPESIVCSGVDLDHDGRKENIHVHLNDFADRYNLLVVEDGSLLWSTCADFAHANWNTVLLYRHNGKDYLMEEENSLRENYLWPVSISSELLTYDEAAEVITAEAQLLLSTEDNRVVIGPVPSTEVYFVYPYSTYSAG